MIILVLNYLTVLVYSYFEKVAGKSARVSPERYCGCFWIQNTKKIFSSKKIATKNDLLHDMMHRILFKLDRRF